MPRAGTWGVEDAQPISVRITVAGQVREGTARVDAQTFDAHPTEASTSPAATASLTLRAGSAVTHRSPSPSGSDWLPQIGDSVLVEAGDGRQWWTQFTGTVEKVTGRWSSGQIQVECTDRAVMLDSSAHREALTSQLRGGKVVGLQVTTLIDHAARSAGFHTVPPPRWETRLHAPMIGSLLPTPGYGNVATTTDDRGSSYFADHVGLVRGHAAARYFMSAPIASQGDGAMEVTMDLLVRRPSGSLSTVDVLGGASGFRLAWDHSTDEIVYGSLNDSGSWVTFRMPRDGATRVACRFGRINGTTQRLQIRRDIDSTTTVRTINTPQGAWTATIVDVAHADGPLSPVVVSDSAPAWASLTDPRTANIRIKEIGWLRASPDLQHATARETLDTIASAECATYWIDNDGIFQWAGRGVLEDQASVETITADGSLQDVDWQTSWAHQARTIRVERRAPGVSIRSTPMLLWSNSTQTGLKAGDVWEQIISPPDDEDWLDIDDSPITLDQTTQRRTSYGTVQGATYIDTYEESESWLNIGVTWTFERLGTRAWKWTAEAWTTLGDRVEVNLQVPTVAHAPNMHAWWAGRPLPRLAGHRLIKWADVTDDNATPTGATQGSPEKIHNASWVVQDDDRLDELRAFLAAAYGSQLPVQRSVQVRPDPRRERGEVVTIRDAYRTGQQVKAVVVGVEGDWQDGDATQALTCRPISQSQITAPPDPTPGDWQSSWVKPT